MPTEMRGSILFLRSPPQRNAVLLCQWAVRQKWFSSRVMRTVDMRSVWVAFKLTYFSDVESGACLLWESQETWMRPERQAPLGLPAWGRCFECSPSDLFFVWGWGMEVRIAWYNLINLFLTPQYTGHHMLPCLSLLYVQGEFENAQKSPCQRHITIPSGPEQPGLGLKNWPRSSFVRKWLQWPLLLLQLDIYDFYLDFSDDFLSPDSVPCTVDGTGEVRQDPCLLTA